MFTWLSLVMSLMPSFFPRDILDETLDLIESVSEGFPTFFFVTFGFPTREANATVGLVIPLLFVIGNAHSATVRSLQCVR